MEIKAGDKLLYNGYETTPSVGINAVLVPGHPEYDGALPGISVTFLKKKRNRVWFFPCKTVDEFFAYSIFSNLVKI